MNTGSQLQTGTISQALLTICLPAKAKALFISQHLDPEGTVPQNRAVRAQFIFHADSSIKKVQLGKVGVRGKGVGEIEIEKR